MTGGECKKMSMINENILKRQAKNDNKPKECIKSRKEDYLKPQGESMLDSMKDQKKSTLHDKRWFN